jgi:alpha-L-arabinofuranosidase
VENVPYYNKSNDWWPGAYSGRVPYVTCYVSKFGESGKLGVILINKHPERDFDIEVFVDKNTPLKNEGAAWMLRGPEINSQNDGQPRTVAISKYELHNAGNNFKYTIPAHSVTAIEIERLN